MINDALLEAKSNVNESELYELIDEDIRSSSKEKKGFFDAISKSLKQWTASKKSAKKEKKELGNVGIHSSFRERSKLNFAFTSQVIVALREKISREKNR